jgi:type IV secretory pathway VirB2 component (pilin)
MDTTEATSVAREAGNSRVVEWGARLGYVVLGILHLVIAWIAVKIAWNIGGGSKSADTTGALKEISSSGTGPFLLGVAVVGFAMLAIWQLIEAAISHGEAKDRGKAAAKGLMYAVFAWTSFKVAQGGGGSNEKQTEDFTAGLMGSPGGRLLVGVLGLVVLGVAGYHVYKGWTKKFLEDLREHPGQWAVVAGRIGYIAKGVALVIVGFFFLVAAWQANPEKAQGLDGALKTLKDQAFGPFLLTLVAVGIAAYGVYSFARARYARL